MHFFENAQETDVEKPKEENKNEESKPTADPESKEAKITAVDNKVDSVQKIDKIEEALSDNVTLLFMTSRTETKSDVCMENIKLSTNYDTSSTESSIVIPEYEACNVSDSLNNYLENASSVLQDKICYRAECNNFKFREQRSISVSTDSAPSLNVGEEQIINQRKILVLHELTEEHCISTKSEKCAEEIMDKRMGAILKTMNEDAVDDEIIKESHRPNEITVIKKPMFQMATVRTDMEETKRTDEEIIKIEAKHLFDRYSKVIEELNIRQQKLTCHIRHDVENNCDHKNIAKLVSRAVRAYYNPCAGPFVRFMNSDLIDQTPASWQFRIISHPSNDPATLSRLVKERVMPNNMSSYEMNLWRSPISCPDTDCIYKTFLSDFTKHLLVDHNHLPMERVYPRNVKNFFIDVRVAFVDVPKVRMLFLLQERITELGHNTYNDSLPLLIMTSVLRLSDIMQSEEIKQNSDLKFLLIWVSGLETGKYPTNMTLVAWKNTGRYPEYQVVITGSILPITKVLTPLQVLETGNCLLLTPRQQKILTAKNLLHLQLFIH
ncbi:uncharacterized protein LOC119679600 [Teleopsis dalmanni]|uniref:uncharacterized protein LOC119679600 n=1 Tax=Teleopsis dalmanni TaxID=139649 RepID=UPI0018CCB530|nr:uncharacterized protein LOC119679600 [Teleopsis dalmanni]